MRVVIVGVGDIGRKLAEMLAHRANMELVLIDSDEKHCERLASEVDALVLHGDGTDPEILKKAQLDMADALVAVTGSDPLNTVIAMLGHRLGVKKIIVKLNDVGLRPACGEIGVTKIIAPKIAAAAEILSVLSGLDRVDFSLVAQGGLSLVEVDVGRSAGRRLSELEPPEGILVVAVLRGNEVTVPRGHTKLEAGDLLLVLLENESAQEKLRKILNRQ